MLAPAKLAELLTDGFNMSELETLAFRVGVKLDNLKGDTLTAKARELARHCKRRGQLDALIVAARNERPNLCWSAQHDDLSSATLASGTSKLTGLWSARIEGRQNAQATCLRSVKAWVGIVGAAVAFDSVIMIILLIKVLTL